MITIKKFRLPIIFIVSMSFMTMIVILNKKCDRSDKEEWLLYYRKSNLRLTGKIIGAEKLERNDCILNVEISTCNVDSYMGKRFCYNHPDIELKDNKAKIISGFRNILRLNDSISIVVNEGVFRVYRKDSLILDQGLSYFKNGVELDN